MKKNGTTADKKLYIFAVDMENYQFLAHIAGKDWSMALIVNRLIKDAREKGDEFVQRLMITR